MAEVTDVRVYRVESTGSLRAYATVTLDNAYAVHGLKIMDGENGLWISMPASKNKRGEFKDIFHPVSREARQVLVDAVLEAYQSEGAPPPRKEKKEVEEEKEGED